MNHVLKIVRFFIAGLMLAVLALPASAAQPPSKQYSFVTSGPTAGGPISVTIKNETPSGGNSAINSFILKRPSNNVTFSGPYSPVPGATFDASTGDLKVSGFTGLLPKDQQGTHQITVTFYLIAVCSPSDLTITWLSTTPNPQITNVSVHTGTFSNTTFAWLPLGTGPGLNPITTTLPGGVCKTLGYDGNGSDGGTQPAGGSFYPGASVTVAANTFTKTGSTFTGWNTAAGGGGTSYAPGATLVMPANDVTLFAQWRNTLYPLTYFGNGNTGGSAPSGASYTYGTQVTLANGSGLSKAGYTFNGWNTQADGLGTSYAADGTLSMPASAVNLYAKWTQNTMAIVGPATAPHLNDPFTVKVTFDPPAGTAVTLTSTNCTLSPAPGTASPANNTDGFVNFSVTVTSAPSNACNFVATATDGSYATAQQSIAISKAWTGELGTCNQPPGSSVAGYFGSWLTHDPPYAFVGTPNWGLLRADKDAKPPNTTCTPVVQYVFQFDPDATPKQKAAFIITGAPEGQNPAVEYVLLWKPIDTNHAVSGYPGKPYAIAELAWLKDTNQNFIYVPGLPCADADLEQVDGSPLPIIPNLPPFNDGCSSTGGCTQPAGYQPGATAQMCIAQEGWTSVGKDVNGNILRQYWHRVYDFKDGGAQLSN